MGSEMCIRDSAELDEEEAMGAWMTYSEALVSAGVWVSGNALLPPETATVVRTDGGSTVLTDGPFAETKEAIGGYDIIDVADLDAALSWAKQAPVSTAGLVEVRPVMELPPEFGIVAE